MNLTIILIGVVAIVGVSSLNWRLSVKAIFVIIILEGVLRKWVLPQASDLIYFLKDLVLLGAYLRFFLGSEPKYPFQKTYLNIFLLLSTFWCVFQAFNPSLGSPIVGLFGIKAYLFYIPLMWMIPSLFKSQEELYEFLRNYLLLVIPVALLATVQYTSPLDSPINVYAGGVESNASVGGNPRVTGTFPYLTGYSVYLSFCFSILIPFLSLPQPKIWQLLTYTEMLLVVGTSFMTGARSLVLFEVLFVGGYLFLLWLDKSAQAFTSSKKFILPVILSMVVVPTYFQGAMAAFFDRAENSDNITNRIVNTFINFEEATSYKGFDGYGTGATHQAVPVLRSTLQLPMGEPLPPSEEEMRRVVLETGPLGWFFWYGMRLMLIISLFRVFRWLKTPFLNNLALAALLFHLISFTGQLVSNVTVGIYYWFFSGLIFLLPQLEYRYFLAYKQQTGERYV